MFATRDVIVREVPSGTLQLHYASRKLVFTDRRTRETTYYECETDARFDALIYDYSRRPAPPILLTVFPSDKLFERPQTPSKRQHHTFLLVDALLTCGLDVIAVTAKRSGPQKVSVSIPVAYFRYLYDLIYCIELAGEIGNIQISPVRAFLPDFATQSGLLLNPHGCATVYLTFEGKGNR